MAIGLTHMLDPAGKPIFQYLCHKSTYLDNHFGIKRTIVSHSLFFLSQVEKDDKIIAVCADDPEYHNLNNLSHLSLTAFGRSAAFSKSVRTLLPNPAFLVHLHVSPIVSVV
jgi:hypothetical protein